MTWTSTAVVARIDELTFEERVAVEDVLDAAQAWADGTLPAHEAAAIGDIGTPSHTRYIAVRSTSKDDPRYGMLLALIDVLIQMQGWRITRQGIFGSFEIRESDANVARAMPSGRLHYDAA